MAKRFAFPFFGALALLFGFAFWLAAQEAAQDSPSGVIRVVVSMVQLNVAVTDEKGNYVTNLRPSDFEISEDGISQKLASFEEGNESPQNLMQAQQDPARAAGPAVAEQFRGDPPPSKV